MAAMLKREEELRLSDDTQRAYASRDDMDMLELVLSLQLQVVREFGLADNYVHIMRSALSVYSREELPLEKLPFYIRYNRSSRGALRVGDSVTDVPLTLVTRTDRVARPSSMISFLTDRWQHH